MIGYTLIILTDGRPGLIEQTLASFWENVTPKPRGGVIVDDGGKDGSPTLLALAAHHGLTVVRHVHRYGFCKTVQHAWALAAVTTEDYVFWLEDDFVFNRPLDLHAPAHVLATHPELAQMGLMRDAVNDREENAGGLIGLYRDRLEDRLTSDGDPWLYSRTNFSTTCSLIRTQFMRDEPWPDYEAECEGRYSIDLLTRGYSFAAWGDGEPWITHIGDHRVGIGY